MLVSFFTDAYRRDTRYVLSIGAIDTATAVPLIAATKKQGGTQE